MAFKGLIQGQEVENSLLLEIVMHHTQNNNQITYCGAHLVELHGMQH